MSNHITYVWEHPNIHWDIITSGINFLANKKKLRDKCAEYNLTTEGWTVKHRYTRMEPDPRDNEGVSGAAWGNYMTHYGYEDE